ERFQNTDSLHHDDASCAVVGGSRTGVPGVEVCAQHHELIFLVRARNLGDGVVLHRIVIVESVGNVQLERDILLLLQQPRDASPVLDRNGELRDGGGLSSFVGSARLHEHSSAAGSLAAVIDDGQNFFFGEELVQVFDELHAL